MTALRSLSLRATMLLLGFVSGGIALMAGLSYRDLRDYTAENSLMRIERAAKAAASLTEARFPDAFLVERTDKDLPALVRLKGSEPLISRAEPAAFDRLVKEIGRINNGAANVFAWNATTQAFDRFATTFRRPDGSLPPAFSIGAGHPAYGSIRDAKVFTGDVPVMGRMRYAYLTPIVFSGGELAGLLAIDVGWSDDLVTGQERLKERIFIASLLILAIATTIGGLLHWRMLAPIPALARVAHRIGAGEQGISVPGLGRADEVGHLAEGLERTNQLYHELEILAFSDPLTGLGNRAHLRRELKRTFAREAWTQVSALILINIDQFRGINEGFGATIGDRLLIEIGDRLKAWSGPDNPRPARTGSDEFALILRDCPPERLDHALDDLRDRLSRPWAFDGTIVEFTVGFGVVSLPAHAANADEAERNVQLALRAAKARGKGNVSVFDPTLDARAKREHDLSIALREALQRNELTVHFQLQASTTARDIFGLEALVRWPQGGGSMIPPGEFIPIAEANGLIVELGSWVLDETCRVIRQWLDSAILVPHVSINVSPAQLWQPNFVETVKETLERHRIPPRMIYLEVTEGLFVNFSEERIQSIFAGLHAVGVKIALDDFGTGYSSLGYLHRVHLDQIKIDRSFAVDIDKDRAKQRLLKGITALAAGLKLEVIVEGAETEAETRFLMRTGCNAIQGYFFARPCSALLVPQEIENVRRMLGLLNFEDNTPLSKAKRSTG
ncbi:EAL domain-containing protein [Rhabdaerophilum sp. SD176]|uniref:bifunctional diguanylate cyclase/phosphodiesterase n=1 Tax=Rhabdaerophilum sp. SD176 TaxID=2983548 RepID=UPI0024DF85D4|nr:EAL domain-containing protein [Rhabdaerophilum sp. SD176]